MRRGSSFPGSSLMLFVLLIACPAVAVSGEQPVQPTSNWAAPLYWQPGETQAESPAGRRALHAAPSPLGGATPTPLPFVAVTPCRVADTRGYGFTGEYGPPAIGGSGTRVFTIAGQCGIPADAVAVSFNFTVWGTASYGNLTVYPAGGAVPVVSTLNWPPGTLALANAAVVPLGTGGDAGKIAVANQSATTIDVFFDVNGYYSPQGVVNSLNALTGSLTLVGGTNVTVTPSGQTLSIATAAAPGTMTLGQPGDPILIGQGYRETWSVGMDSWLPMPGAGAPPNLVRGAHCTVWAGSKFFVWGGQDNSYQALNTGALYDPATDTWTATKVSGAPAARKYHQCVWTGSKVVVWGGEDSLNTALNSGSRYDPVFDSWDPMTTTNAPAGRMSFAAAWAGGRVVVWGGGDRTSGSYTFPAAGGRYDPEGNTWSAASTLNQPTQRAQPAFVSTGAKLIVWGGYSGATPPFTVYNTGGQYDPAGDTWTLTSSSGLAARYGFAFVWTGSRMIVWGGVSGNSPSWVSYNDGALYDPGGDSWTPMATAGAPSARSAPGVWTGSRMIVWGGTSASGSSSTALATGGIYDPGSNRWVAATSTVNAPSARYAHQTTWSGTPFNEMLLIGPDNAGSIYRPLSMYVKN
jgi:N-acetylneuraminic acid mutarotase